MVDPENTDRLHHLSRDNRGRWEIRLTIDKGKRITGKPIRIKLGKCTEAEAIRQRDLQITTLNKAEVKIILRKQKRERSK